jgi:hypothetical protein
MLQQLLHGQVQCQEQLKKRGTCEGKEMSSLPRGRRPAESQAVITIARVNFR